mgnify:CR=1 FL=1
MNLKKFTSTEEAVELLGIGRSRLMALKASGELKVGTHWVYLTGRKSGPIGWSVEAINQWQIDESLRIVEAPINAASEIEDFSSMGV